DRLWTVGEQRADLSNVRDPQKSRHRSSSGRLGPGGRTRMALLASPDVGIRRRTLLKSVGFCQLIRGFSRCLRRYFRLAMGEPTRKEIPWAQLCFFSLSSF